MDLGDLVGAGQLGLLEAARKFDPGRGTAFSAYARSRIRGSIIDAHRRKNYDFELHEELGENSTEPAAGNPLNDRLFEQFRDVIGTLLRALPDNESYTIAATLRGETLQEIGEHLGVTESAACLTRQAACTKLGVLLRAGGYRQSDLLPD